MATRRARRGRATSGARRGRSYGRPAKGDGVDDDARRAAAEGSECEPWSQRRALARGRVVGRRGRARLGFGVVLAHRWRGGRRVRRDRAVVADKRAKRCRRATRGLVAVRVARRPRAGCLQLWVHARRRRGGGPGRKGQRRRGVAVGWRMRHLRRPRERLILSFFVLLVVLRFSADMVRPAADGPFVDVGGPRRADVGDARSVAVAAAPTGDQLGLDRGGDRRPELRLTARGLCDGVARGGRGAGRGDPQRVNDGSRQRGRAPNHVEPGRDSGQRRLDARRTAPPSAGPPAPGRARRRPRPQRAARHGRRAVVVGEARCARTRRKSAICGVAERDDAAAGAAASPRAASAAARAKRGARQEPPFARPAAPRSAAARARRRPAARARAASSPPRRSRRSRGSGGEQLGGHAARGIGSRASAASAQAASALASAAGASSPRRMAQSAKAARRRNNDGEHSGRRRRGGAADAAQRRRRVALRGPEPSGRRAQRRDEQVEPSVGDDAPRGGGGRFAVVPATGAERLDGERRAPRG